MITNIAEKREGGGRMSTFVSQSSSVVNRQSTAGKQPEKVQNIIVEEKKVNLELEFE